MNPRLVRLLSLYLNHVALPFVFQHAITGVAANVHAGLLKTIKSQSLTYLAW